MSAEKYFPPLRFLFPQHARVSKGQLGWFFAEKIPTNASRILLAGKLVIEFANHCYLTRSNFPFAGNVSLRKLNANEQTRSVSLKCSLLYTVPYCRIILLSKEIKEMGKIHIRGSILSVKKHFQQMENWNA